MCHHNLLKTFMIFVDDSQKELKVFIYTNEHFLYIMLCFDHIYMCATYV